MRAIGLMKYGRPEVLELIEVPEVKPEADEILVKAFCAVINPTDILARNGGIAKSQNLMILRMFQEWIFLEK